MDPKVKIATTGKKSELITKLPITQTAGTTPMVAMSLGPHGTEPLYRLPDLLPGDELLVSAEAEVTTDTAAQGVTNVGTPYTFAPTLQGRLLLAPSRGAIQRGIEIASLAPVAVTQVRHHHVATLAAEYTVPSAGLPWPAAQSCLNLILSASNPRAKINNVLIVGENEPDGTVKGDKGRINVIRLRPGNQTPLKATPSKTPLAATIPVDKDARTVVFSQKLGSLKKGEQIAVRAALHTSANHLTYPARISTRIFLADSRTQTDTGGQAQKLASTGGELCENSGFNCVKSEGVGVSRRSGVLLIEADATRDQYLNLVAVSGDPKRKAQPGDQLKVVGGFLERVRYGSQMRG